MIDSLTKAQQNKFPKYVDKWIKIGLSCEPINLETCKKYARLTYSKAGLTCPDVFYVAKGPKDAIKILDEQTNSQAKKEMFSNFIFGQHESWLSFYDYVQTELEIDCSLLDGLFGMAKNCGWWYPGKDFVIFVERHTFVSLENGVLHNDTGPAIEYQDGTQVWSINGVRVNEQIVLRPETLTLKQINSESNIEVRAIMINRYGWHNYLKGINAKLLDFRENSIENTKEALYNTKDFGKRLVVSCPTGRVFTLGVHDTVNTCEEAQNWLGNDNRKEFNIIGRT